MGDTVFKDATRQSDWGYNQEGDTTNSMKDAVQKGLENCAGIKQGMAMGKRPAPS